MEDIKSMSIVENLATLEDGHYSLKLPFKRNNVALNNNFSVVKQMMQKLKFLNNGQFYEESEGVRIQVEGLAAFTAELSPKVEVLTGTWERWNQSWRTELDRLSL